MPPPQAAADKCNAEIFLLNLTHVNTMGLYTGTGSSTWPKWPGHCCALSPHVVQLKKEGERERHKRQQARKRAETRFTAASQRPERQREHWLSNQPC